MAGVWLVARSQVQHLTRARAGRDLNPPLCPPTRGGRPLTPRATASAPWTTRGAGQLTTAISRLPRKSANSVPRLLRERRMAEHRAGPTAVTRQDCVVHALADAKAARRASSFGECVVRHCAVSIASRTSEDAVSCRIINVCCVCVCVAPCHDVLLLSRRICVGSASSPWTSMSHYVIRESNLTTCHITH